MPNSLFERTLFVFFLFFIFDESFRINFVVTKRFVWRVRNVLSVVQSVVHKKKHFDGHSIEL